MNLGGHTATGAPQRLPVGAGARFLVIRPSPLCRSPCWRRPQSATAQRLVKGSGEPHLSGTTRRTPSHPGVAALCRRSGRAGTALLRLDADHNHLSSHRYYRQLVHAHPPRLRLPQRRNAHRYGHPHRGGLRPRLGGSRIFIHGNSCRLWQTLLPAPEATQPSQVPPSGWIGGVVGIEAGSSTVDALGYPRGLNGLR